MGWIDERVGLADLPRPTAGNLRRALDEIELRDAADDRDLLMSVMQRIMAADAVGTVTLTAELRRAANHVLVRVSLR